MKHDVNTKLLQHIFPVEEGSTTLDFYKIRRNLKGSYLSVLMQQEIICTEAFYRTRIRCQPEFLQVVHMLCEISSNKTPRKQNEGGKINKYTKLFSSVLSSSVENGRKRGDPGNEVACFDSLNHATHFIKAIN